MVSGCSLITVRLFTKSWREASPCTLGDRVQLAIRLSNTETVALATTAIPAAARSWRVNKVLSTCDVASSSRGLSGTRAVRMLADESIAGAAWANATRACGPMELAIATSEIRMNGKGLRDTLLGACGR